MWILLGSIAAIAVLIVAVAGSMGVFNSPMTEPEPVDPINMDNPRFAPAMFGYSRSDVDSYVTQLHERIRALEQSAEDEPDAAEHD